jgi:hypothetical protein
MLPKLRHSPKAETGLGSTSGYTALTVLKQPDRVGFELIVILAAGSHRGLFLDIAV